VSPSLLYILSLHDALPIFQLIESDNCDAVMEQVKKDTVSSHIALPVGGDQRYVDMNLKERINHFNENLSEDQLVESNYDKLFERSEEHTSELQSRFDIVCR